MRPPRWMVAAAAVVGGLLLLPLYMGNLELSGDTQVLLTNVRTVLTAVRAGRWHGWGGHFPALQQLVAVPLVLAGLDDHGATVALAWVSLLAVVTLVVLSWVVLSRRSRVVAWAVVLVDLSGPLLWYGHSSFGEGLAAVVTVALVAVCLLRARGPAIIVLLALGILSKDVAFPFLAILAAVSAWVGAGAPRQGWPRGARLPAVGAGVVLGLALLLAFNFASYGAPLNSTQAQPLYIVPTLKTQASFLAAIWLSPNGGLVPFWLSMAVLLVLAGVAAARGARDVKAGRWQALVPALAAAAILGGLSLGFSRWVAPLGWIAWGPRYLVPWLPALGLLLGYAYAPALAEILAGARRAVLPTSLIAVAVAAFALPQYVVLFQRSLGIELFMPDAYCPRIAYIEQGATYYYHCTNHQLWTKGSVLLDAFQPALGLPFVLGMACVAALLVAAWGLVLAPARDPRASG